jgi:L-asparaginase II
MLLSRFLKIEGMSSAELRTALDSMNIPTSEVRVVQCAEGPARTRKGPPLTREELIEAMVQAVR